MRWVVWKSIPWHQWMIISPHQFGNSLVWNSSDCQVLLTEVALITEMYDLWCISCVFFLYLNHAIYDTSILIYHNLLAAWYLCASLMRLRKASLHQLHVWWRTPELNINQLSLANVRTQLNTASTGDTAKHCEYRGHG